MHVCSLMPVKTINWRISSHIIFSFFSSHVLFNVQWSFVTKIETFKRKKKRERRTKEDIYRTHPQKRMRTSRNVYRYTSHDAKKIMIYDIVQTNWSRIESVDLNFMLHKIMSNEIITIAFILFIILLLLFGIIIVLMIILCRSSPLFHFSNSNHHQEHEKDGYIRVSTSTTNGRYIHI